MILDVKIKKIGKGDYQDSKLQLPDDCAEILDGFKLELLEYEQDDSLTIYFLKNEIDFYSYTIYNPKNKTNLLDGFKTAIEKLKQLKEQIND
jgi:hypothetical protein